MAGKKGVPLLSGREKEALTRRAEADANQLLNAAESGTLEPPARAYLLTELLRLVAAGQSEFSIATVLAGRRREALQATTDQGASVKDLAVTLALSCPRVYQMLAGTGRSGIASRPLVAGPGPGRPTNAERDARLEREARNAARNATTQTPPSF